jgi:hypothetical protein
MGKVSNTLSNILERERGNFQGDLKSLRPWSEGSTLEVLEEFNKELEEYREWVTPFMNTACIEGLGYQEFIS